MIGKIIGAFAGDKLAKQTSAIGGPSGAALGVIAATALRRLSLPAMIALGAGGYVAKKLYERNEQKKAERIDPTPPEVVGTERTVAAA